MLSYPVLLTPDPETGQVMVDFPDLPFCHSAGDDEDEALLHAKDALESALEHLVDERRLVPLPSIADGRPTIPVPVLMAAKVLLWNEMLTQGVRKADMARLLGCHLPQVDRLLNLRHSSKIEQVESAFGRLGCMLEIEVRRVGMGKSSLENGS